MRPRVGRIDLHVGNLRRARLADHRFHQAVAMRDVIEPEASLDAQAILVRRAGAAVDVEDLVVLDLVLNLAADAAVGADTVDFALRLGGDGEVAFVDQRRFEERSGRTGLDALSTRHAGRMAHGVVEIKDDLGVVAAIRHANHVVNLHLAAGANAEVAVNAGVEIDRHRRMAAVGGGRLAPRQPARRDADPIGPTPELGVGVMRRIARRLIGDQQLEHHSSRELRPFAGDLHFHSGRGLADARCGENPFAFYLDHAGAAVPVRAVARLRRVTQMRDLGAEAIGHLKDRLARPRLDRAPVQNEADGVAHRRSSSRSSRKCLNAILSGFAAACPRPQIDASVIARLTSSMRLSSHRGRSINLTSFSVPTRHGVHWPHDSSSKKRSRLSATRFMSSWSESTTTAAEPMKHPCCSSVPKSSGRSPIDAGRIPPDAPPGRYPLKAWPCCIPPQYSSINSRTEMPAGASFTPGSLIRPDTEKLRSPVRPRRPWPVNHCAAFSTMSRTQYTVSTLWIRVGRPNSPTWAGNGGLWRGKPRLPSMLSSIADSSPQI